MKFKPARGFTAPELQAVFSHGVEAFPSLARGLQGLDFLENRIEPLLELPLGPGLALGPAKAGVIFN